MTSKTNRKPQAGFSTLEMMVVVFVSIIITCIAVPQYVRTSQFLRAAGDLRSLNGATAQAKMRAAADFTHARLYANLANNNFQIQVWDKTNSCWYAEMDRTQTCLVGGSPAANGPVVALSQGITYGFGSTANGPTPGSAAIAQSPNCRQGVAGTAPGSNIANTACIEFNSRGTPVDSTNTPVATGAFYITNNTVVNAVTVSATGSIQTWSTPASSTNWHAQ
jgi:Tfp pilus assembly protein FimT